MVWILFSSDASFIQAESVKALPFGVPLRRVAKRAQSGVHDRLLKFSQFPRALAPEKFAKVPRIFLDHRRCRLVVAKVEESVPRLDAIPFEHAVMNLVRRDGTLLSRRDPAVAPAQHAHETGMTFVDNLAAHAQCVLIRSDTPPQVHINQL